MEPLPKMFKFDIFNKVKTFSIGKLNFVEFKNKGTWFTLENSNHNFLIRFSEYSGEVSYKNQTLTFFSVDSFNGDFYIKDIEHAIYVALNVECKKIDKQIEELAKSRKELGILRYRIKEKSKDGNKSSI